MNPLNWLLIVAPAAVLAALLFVLIYQQTESTAQIERQRIHLESLRFDRDFAKAWNGEDLATKGLDAQIEAAEAELAAAEQARPQGLKKLTQRLESLFTQGENNDEDN